MGDTFLGGIADMATLPRTLDERFPATGAEGGARPLNSPAAMLATEAKTSRRRLRVPGKPLAARACGRNALNARIGDLTGDGKQGFGGIPSGMDLLDADCFGQE
jgi:hypothetical protein